MMICSQGTKIYTLNDSSLLIADAYYNVDFFVLLTGSGFVIQAGFELTSLKSQPL